MSFKGKPVHIIQLRSNKGNNLWGGQHRSLGKIPLLNVSPKRIINHVSNCLLLVMLLIAGKKKQTTLCKSIFKESETCLKPKSSAFHYNLSSNKKPTRWLCMQIGKIYKCSTFCLLINTAGIISPPSQNGLDVNRPTLVNHLICH